MVNEVDLKLGDGRILHVYDTGADEGAAFPCSGITGRLTSAPLPRLCSQRQSDWACVGCRTIDPDTVTRRRTRVETGLGGRPRLERRRRPRYRPVRRHGSLRWGSDALACGALLEDRVLGVVSMAGLAPCDAGGLDWLRHGSLGRGLAARSSSGSRGEAALRGSGAEYDPEFTPADEAALANEWSWLLDVVRPALAQGPGG